MKRFGSVAAVLLMAVVAAQLTGCGGGVALTRVWTSPEYSGRTYNNVLVVGLARKPQIRSVFEYQLAHDFKSRGVGALASLDGVPADAELGKNTFDQYFKDENLDAVLVTGLVSADTVDQYTPGRTYATPVAYYDTWYGYYGAVYTVNTDPGYWTENTEFVLESNLYDVSTEKLIWRGVSKAVNPETVIDVVEELSEALVKRLGSDGLIRLQQQ